MKLKKVLNFAVIFMKGVHYDDRYETKKTGRFELLKSNRAKKFNRKYICFNIAKEQI